jgi:hypothetical protein
VVADLFTYVDDQRCTGPTELECWDACRKIGSSNTFLGIQDASRKRREPSQTPGAWAGSVIRTDAGVVGVMVGQDKWEKGQRLSQELWEMSEGYQREGTLMDRKRLESIRGFLLYLTRTYPNMTPHLKGMHLTIDGWRPDRNGDGWRIPKRLSEERSKTPLLDQNADGEWVERFFDKPAKVHAASRFRDDAYALRSFFDRASPPPE